VDCFKTDFGERIPTDVAWFDGADPVKMHNFYTYVYNRTVFELLEEERGRGQAVVFARSATAGSQKFPVHWGGDCAATYESMAESMRGGLSLGLSGFGFWSHDIGGFERTPTPDLYNRWAAFGLLSSHSRLHGNESYRVPWLFGEESVDVLRFFVHLKCSLMPYLFTAAAEASREGVPVMRAMILEFPEDPACAYLDRQYMLGASMLVAPVFASDGAVSYYLPKGRWTNFLTGEGVEGGCWRNETHGYKSIPLMVRPHSVIPVGQEETKPDYDHADNVTFQVFELDDGREVTGPVSDAKGREDMRISVRREGRTITITKSGAKKGGAKKAWRVLLRNVHGTLTIEGGSLKTEAQGAMITPNKDTDIIVARL
jgi:alpha-D-xyloside xylohydrolase